MGVVDDDTFLPLVARILHET